MKPHSAGSPARFTKVASEPTLQWSDLRPQARDFTPSVGAHRTIGADAADDPSMGSPQSVHAYDRFARESLEPERPPQDVLRLGRMLASGLGGDLRHYVEHDLRDVGRAPYAVVESATKRAYVLEAGPSPRFYANIVRACDERHKRPLLLFASPKIRGADLPCESHVDTSEALGAMRSPAGDSSSSRSSRDERLSLPDDLSLDPEVLLYPGQAARASPA